MFLNFYTVLKVTFHLQLLQNIGYITHVVHPWAYLTPSSLYLSLPSPSPIPHW